MNKKQTVSIIIPNHNGISLLRQFLPKVIDVADGAEIIVVDDNSTDDSVSWMKQIGTRITVIEKKEHTGFASTVNTGVTAAKGDIVYLLNTDVVPEKGFLSPLLTVLEDEQVFAVGSLEKSHEKEGIVTRGRGKAKWTKGFFIHRKGESDLRDTAWVSGGSAAFRKSLWVKFGGMDELYNPFYWEDIDLSYRALKNGYKIRFEPTSIVHHYHDKGSIKREFSPEYVKLVAYRNQFIFIWKNLSDAGIFRDHFLWLPVRLFQALFRFDWRFTAGLFWAVLLLPAIIHSRHLQQQFWRIPDREIPL